jgi:Uma2 family endonuclease
VYDAPRYVASAKNVPAATKRIARSAKSISTSTTLIAEPAKSISASTTPIAGPAKSISASTTPIAGSANPVLGLPAVRKPVPAASRGRSACSGESGVRAAGVAASVVSTTMALVTQAAEQSLVTEDEYIARERLADTKHELIHSQVVAMAGGSPRHNAIAGNVAGSLGNRLQKRRCLVFPGAQRVHVEATGLYTYPDVSVACDGLRFHAKHQDTLLNPCVVVEVLSDSTEAYDRGAKFAHYRTIPSLQEYVLVSQHEHEVEHYRRLDSGQWVLTAYQGASALVALPALGCELPLAEGYDKLDLLAPPPPAVSS